MKHLNTLAFIYASCFNLLFAQNPVAPVADFSVSQSGKSFKFEPKLPPVTQVAGAPEAYWTYLWEFGDGGMSTQASPTHTYTREGEFSVTLDAIAHYDKGQKPTRKKTKVVSTNREAYSSADMPDVFEEKGKQAIAMWAAAQPRVGEELSFVMSYRNKSSLPINGKLHLFFNEKKFPTRHFKFLESRPCFGEVEAPTYSAAEPMMPWDEWTAFGLLVTAPQALEAPTILTDARGRYKEEHAWSFQNLDAGNKRNFFFSLAAEPTIVKDVNTLIHVTAVFVPDDPAVPAEPAELEMKIVAAHDPNAIAVSDNVVNYRTLGNKKIDYKVEFQNNGKGPAGSVIVKIEIPEGLEMKKMKPIDWKPKCPVCPRGAPSKTSCLDTLTTSDGLQFTFHNIYLPGSRQEGVEKYDSTKGYVKYRIEADKNMPKRSFRSRAKIIFDREAPIYTNYTRTRFRIGMSPGIKVGWNFVPDSLRSGYFFIGASLSPFKSWRIYPQVELLAGLKGQQDVAAEDGDGITQLIKTSPNVQPVPDTILDTVLVSSLRYLRRGFVSFEVPVLLRKNFNDRLGLGFGVSARISIEDGQNITETQNTTYDWQIMDTSAGTLELVRNVSTEEPVLSQSPYSATKYRFTAFGDLTFGSVRAGPNLGIRAGAVLGKGREFKPFVQFSLEIKM